jgi:hypothetical protein
MRVLALPLLAGLAAVPIGLANSGGPVTAVRATPPVVHGDTVVEARQGDRIRVILSEGRVVLSGAGSGALVADDDGDPNAVRIQRRGSTLVVEPLRRGGRDAVLRLQVPEGVPVEVNGDEVEVVASGVASDLRVAVVDGDVRVRDVSGSVELRTVTGDIDVRQVGGGVSVATVDGRVGVFGAAGDVTAESMDGDVVIEGVGGSEVHAVTVDGDVRYQGPIRAGGRVRLVTHDGDVTAEVPEGASADVEVSTYDGQFLPDFPVTVGRVEAGKPLRFRMGSGGAWLEMQAFDGDIQLRHGPGR